MITMTQVLANQERLLVCQAGAIKKRRLQLDELQRTIAGERQRLAKTQQKFDKCERNFGK